MLSHETPSDIQSALRELVRDFEKQSDQSRREYVRKCLRAHEFFRGNQYLWWDARIGEYRAPTQTGGLMSGATPQFAQNLYVINIYQGFAMSLIAILTANQPTQRFFPLRVDSPEDRKAADKANDLMKIFEHTQKSHERLLEEVYLLWCDGTFGSYVHTVTDGDQFGWTERDITEIQTVPIGNDSYVCQACGAMATEPGACTMCGGPIGPEGVIPSPTMQKEVVVGKEKKAKSKVVWDIVGGLELKLPPTAKKQAEFPYLIRAREVPKSAVRATYPELANRIGRTMGGGNVGDTDTILEVRARRQTAQGTTIDNRSVLVNQGDDVTLKEIWLRSNSFWQLDDERMRGRLLEMFPNGCRVVFADDLFCEVIEENMDDRWRVCHALPGRGQVREPIGGTLIQIQEIVNDMTNIVRDVIEFTMPATFVDNEVLDVAKWSRSNVIPGATYNVRPRGNRPVSDAFWQTQPGQLPQYTAQLLSEMRTQVPQFTVGAFPAAYGGGTGSNNTASGIALEKDAAMGRIGIYWRVMKQHHSEVAPLLVREFARCAEDPEIMTEAQEGGSLANVIVSPGDFDSGQFQAFPESAEDYPTTWPQRQGMLMQGFQNPLTQPDMMKLSNWDNIKRTLGIELEHKGEKAYKAQWDIIDQLLQSPPQMVPVPPDPMTGMPAIDPTTGMPAMQPQTTIPPGPLDDNGPMLEACLDFDISERGMRTRMENPQGYQNFLLHALARKAAMAPPMPPGPPPGGPGGGPPGPPPGPQ